MEHNLRARIHSFWWLAVLGVNFFAPIGQATFPMRFYILEGKALLPSSVSAVFPNRHSNCECRNLCSVHISCTGVTAYEIGNGVYECHLTNADHLAYFHMQPNATALTLIKGEEPPPCSHPFRSVPEFGCIQLVKIGKTFTPARDHCKEADADLLVIDFNQREALWQMLIQEPYDVALNLPFGWPDRIVASLVTILALFKTGQVSRTGDPWERSHARCHCTTNHTGARLWFGVENGRWLGQSPLHETWTADTPVCGAIGFGGRIIDVDCDTDNWFICKKVK